MKSIVPQKKIGWQFYMTWKKNVFKPRIIPEVSRGQSIGLTFSGGCTWRSNTVIMNGGRCGDSLNSRVTLIGSIWSKILLFAFPLSFVLFSAKMIISFSLSSHFSFRQVKMDFFSFFLKFFHCNWIRERSTLKLV